MTYHRVNPVMWDDETVMGLDDITRTLWFLLMTGPQVTALPGLQRGSIATLSDTLRRSPEALAKPFGRLVSAGLVLVDERRRVVCLPKAPKHNPAESPNHLRAWWKRWQEIPDCELKFAHIEALREYADLGKPGHKAVWDHTFGAVKQPSRSPPEALPKPLLRDGISPPEDADANANANADANMKSLELPLLKPPKAGKPPLPFSISDLGRVLTEAAPTRVALDPFVPSLSSPLTAVIRALHESGMGLQQVGLFGRWVAAGGMSWMEDGIGWAWLSTKGKLQSELGKAIAWDRAGRPAIGKQNGRVGPAPVSNWEEPDDEEWGAKQLAKTSGGNHGGA